MHLQHVLKAQMIQKHKGAQIFAKGCGVISTLMREKESMTKTSQSVITAL